MQTRWGRKNQIKSTKTQILKATFKCVEQCGKETQQFDSHYLSQAANCGLPFRPFAGYLWGLIKPGLVVKIISLRQDIIVFFRLKSWQQRWVKNIIKL